MVWNYLDPTTCTVVELKTAYSDDGGKSWSNPVALDSLAERRAGRQSRVHPLGDPRDQDGRQNVHITYAGGGRLGIRRRHSYSTDNSVTWSEPKTIEALGALEGAAGTDSLVLDSKGRFHLLAQIRFPQASATPCGPASLDRAGAQYLIATDDLDVIGDRVHAQWFEATLDQEDRLTMLIESCAAGCIDNSTWPQNPITFGMHTIAPLDELPEVTTVSSATFTAGQPVAKGSIAAAFAPGFSQSITLASQEPLPTTLDGVRIDVLDILGQKRAAGLQFVSPQQINFVIPQDTAPGQSRLRVYRDDKIMAGGRFISSDISPAIFTYNGQGTGVAAATWLFVAEDGTRTSGFIFDPATGQPLPIDFDPAKGQLYLSLYGTGIRNNRHGVTAKIGDADTPVLSAGPQGQYQGLDQINLGPLPELLSVGAEWDIQIFVDGKEANRTIFRTRDRE
ncbi:MAG: hypothetical protein R2748_04640 [Bryobacterales bacterium]